jgi:hypothetical protein
MNTIKTIVKLALWTMLLTACGHKTETEEQKELLRSQIREELKKVPAPKQLDRSKYEILTTNHYPAAENYHVLIKNQKISNDSLQAFVNMFREEYCAKQCNINLYDDSSIKSLVTKYPLGDKEYLKVADHYVATSSFEMTEVWLYPYQDIKYKELGGRNWKVEPLR